MGKLLEHINSDEFKAEQEKREKARRAEIEASIKTRTESDKRRAENTIIDSLENLKSDGWFFSDRKVIKSGTAYQHVLEHASMPYALVHYFGDYSVPREADRVDWKKCQLVETIRYKIELLEDSE